VRDHRHHPACPDNLRADNWNLCQYENGTAIPKTNPVNQDINSDIAEARSKLKTAATPRPSRL
jgi:hypothetical protein